MDFPQLVKPATHRDYDAKNCCSKAGTGAGRFETDSRCNHQEHRVHPKYDGDLRSEPHRVQLMGDPAWLLEQGARRETRDSIGLAVSEVNGCNYCLTVHSYTAEHLAKLPADEIILARKGHANEPKRDAAVQLRAKSSRPAAMSLTPI